MWDLIVARFLHEAVHVFFACLPSRYKSVFTPVSGRKSFTPTQYLPEKNRVPCIRLPYESGRSGSSNYSNTS
jgi:hypothetical protein